MVNMQLQYSYTLAMQKKRDRGKLLLIQTSPKIQMNKALLMWRQANSIK